MRSSMKDEAATPCAGISLLFIYLMKRPDAANTFYLRNYIFYGNSSRKTCEWQARTDIKEAIVMIQLRVRMHPS
jgi:hypothetical protein